MTNEDFCDSHCTWLEHHPDCTIPVGWLGVNKDGEIRKFRTNKFSCSMPLFAHPKKVEEDARPIAEATVLLEARISELEIELLNVYKRLADEKLRADEGWGRYKQANKMAQSAMKAYLEIKRSTNTNKP